MNEPLDPKVALAYASIAAGIGCIAAGIFMNNPSTLAVGAGLLGAPGVVKGATSSEPQGTSQTPDEATQGGDPPLVDESETAPVSADESYGGSGEVGSDVTEDFDDALEFEEDGDA